jgi:tetratricopeptide (TPR) repeat protein
MPEDTRALAKDSLRGELAQLKIKNDRAGGPSPADAAKRLGVHPETVRNWWKLAVQPQPDLFDDFLDFYGVGPELRKRLADLYDKAYAGRQRRDAKQSSEKEDSSGTPRQLPTPASNFVGRKAELGQLDSLIKTSKTQPSVAVISAVSGTAGVGKTALAIHWGHSKERRFPDGTLYVNMRGYDPEHAVQPAEALAQLLRALGAEPIPYSRDERATLFRTMIRDKKMLIVVDNARSADQVRPLLPGVTNSFLIITSRDMMSGLVTREGILRIPLDTLSVDEATTLLRQLVGTRAEEDPEATARLAERCAYLPLALRIAGEFVAVRGKSSLSDLVTELAEEQQRLDNFEVADDPQTAIRSVFSWSYGHLPRELQTAFRLIGYSPSRSYDPHDIAAIVAPRPIASHNTVRTFVRASLMKEVSHNRFELYDLIREYGKELAIATDPENDLLTSVKRLAHHLIWHSAVASDQLYTTAHTPSVSFARDSEAPFKDRASMIQWLTAERENLAPMCEWLSKTTISSLATVLSTTTHRFLDANGYYDDEFAIQNYALHVAEQINDDEARLAAEMRLGTTFLRVGQTDEALERYERVIEGRRRTGDTEGEARALGNRGLVLERTGKFQEALEDHQQAVKLHQEAGDDEGLASSYANIGNALESLGRYADSLDYFTKALTLYVTRGDLAGQGRTLNNAANVSYRLGKYEEALAGYRESVRIKRTISDRLGEANAQSNVGLTLMSLHRDDEALIELERAKILTDEVGEVASKASITNNLASAYRTVERLEEALSYHQEALAQSVSSGDTGLEAEILNDLAMTLGSIKRYDESAEHYRRALNTATAGENRYECGRAFDGLAKIAFLTGHNDQAREIWVRALKIFESLQTPQVTRIKSALEDLA